jgi:HD superfamily phosphohydrolase
VKKINILNDPVSGFIRISEKIYSDIIDHPYFQRLRRIKQLGLTDLVFPSANHTRFQHTLGAFMLMQEALEILRHKGVNISDEEMKAASLAIMLHDIGHGPFSHALENSIVANVDHEEISLSFMNFFNDFTNGNLDLCLKMFTNKYERPFFHDLISGQLDIDRLDYLRRDSFFSGVREGNVGSQRIVQIMNVVDEKLVFERKGIYSIENFLIARRIMYWQVYLHKTVLAAEQILIKIFKRAKELVKAGQKIKCNHNLDFFLNYDISLNDFNNPKVLNKFAALDDYDIIVAIKDWTKHRDKVLSDLCRRLIERDLFKVEISKKVFDKKRIGELSNKLSKEFGLSENEKSYFVFSDFVQNSLYDYKSSKINVLKSDGQIVDISDVSSGFNTSLISDPDQEFFLCYPKELRN